MTRPLGVPFALPSHLRACAEKVSVTDPATVKTVGQLMVAYGDERASTAELRACHAEIVRLIDLHNAAMSSGRLAPK